ncbi:TPA: hypothetical protein N0F65_001541 [Lagenidium giganteum]|uniref:HSF-type DNA-binding domain-containing protein n=1 Tax=Lagenidium giganteum TaxID=4803 RepID=A0AAV2YKS7_9STRA|nr:TPA: hypothetical protein N0F65_001541 [Lagenidium giganteum]
MTAGPTNMSAREVAPFLKNLRKMLECESTAVLRWTPDGRAFEIHDMDAMASQVLPKYFKHRKYSSFQRQLNYFNFRKWTKSKAVVCTFSNPNFLRDQPDLAWRINRKRSLSESKSSSGSPTSTKVSWSRQPSTPVEVDTSTPAALTSLMVDYSASSSDDESMARESSEELDFDSLDWVDALFPSLEFVQQLGHEHWPSSTSDRSYYSEQSLARTNSFVEGCLAL